MNKIFIAYRRDDTGEVVGRIYDHLVLPLGNYEPHDVFKDVDSIPMGVNFKTYLEAMVSQCAVGLVVIGPNWLKITDNAGNPRLHDPRDYVRIEIETMLKRKIPIIPLTVMGAEMPSETELPASLSELSYMNGTSIRRDPDFRADVARVRKFIDQWLKSSTNQDVATIIPPPFEWIDIPEGKIVLEPGGYVPKGGQSFETPAFKIAKYPITNAQFRKFIDIGGYSQRQWWTDEGWRFITQTRKTEPSFLREASLNQATQPVVGVTWYEAMGFCRWLNSLTNELVTLPTEQQWQRAAQGDDNRRYPWGNTFDSSKANTSLYGLQRPSPVTQYETVGVSPFGVVDMVGNVWEWCSNVYVTGDNQPDGANVRVVRGGSWLDAESGARTAIRRGGNPTNEVHNLGFRCSRPIP